MTFRTLLTTTAVALAMASTAYADIVVGVGIPLTGSSAAMGEQIKRGAEQAARDINANGGINGDRVKLEFGDDASDPKQGVSVANKFVADDIRFVIGHFNSGVSIPASAVYAENGILQVSPGSTNPTFTEQGLWNTQRVCGRDDRQGAVAAKYIVREFPDRPLAILHDKTAYGAGIAGEVAKTLKGAGRTVALSDSITVGEKDFSVLIGKMKAIGIGVIYFGGTYTEAALLVRQAGDLGLKAVLVGGDGLASAEFGQIAGPAGKGTRMTFGPDPRKNPAAKDIVAAFREKKIEPEAYTLYGYASLELITSAIELSGSTEPETVAETIRSGNPFNTALGSLTFDAKGDRLDEDFVMYEWKLGAGGKLDYEETE